MLAYLDNILDSEEQEDIGRKIEESGFASELVHRTRDVMRRLRLGAPKLVGRGMGLDPNTVAEYLDNTMATERVADFERVCLESDEHLAETASCHQILTLVLGEPAEVDVESRRRLYAIPATAEKLARAGAKSDDRSMRSVDQASAHRPGPKTKRRLKPTVPDYLRESTRSRFRRRAKYLLVAASLLAIAYFAFGPNREEDPVLDAPEVAVVSPQGLDGETVVQSEPPEFLAPSSEAPDFSNDASDSAASEEPAGTDGLTPEIGPSGEPLIPIDDQMATESDSSPSPDSPLIEFPMPESPSEQSVLAPALRPRAPE